MPRKRLIDEPKTGMKKMYSKSLGDLKGFTYIHGSGNFTLPDFAGGFKKAADWVREKLEKAVEPTVAEKNAKAAGKALSETRTKASGMFDEKNFDTEQKVKEKTTSD